MLINMKAVVRTRCNEMKICGVEQCGVLILQSMHGFFRSSFVKLS